MSSLAVLIAAMPFIPGAPVPKDVKAGDPFPHKVGTKWEYVDPTNPKRMTSVEVIEVKTEDGVRKITTIDQQKKLDTYIVKDGSLYALREDFGKGSAVTYDPPILLIKANMRARDTWTNKYKRKCDDGSVTDDESKRIVGEEEELTTPAGKIKAIPITVKYPSGGEFIIWYSKDGYMVRDEKGQRLELKTFTPGK
jgi:hypothetical protein